MAPLPQEFAFRGARSDDDDTSVFYQTVANAGNYITSHSWVSWLAIILLSAMAIVGSYTCMVVELHE